VSPAKTLKITAEISEKHRANGNNNVFSNVGYSGRPSEFLFTGYNYTVNTRTLVSVGVFFMHN